MAKGHIDSSSIRVRPSRLWFQRLPRLFVCLILAFLVERTVRFVKRQLNEFSTTNWSIGPVRLAPQEIVSARFPGLATESGAVGILGADVLSRFGAVTINYSLGDLLIPGPEGPPSSGVHLIKGPTDKATPSALLAGLPPPINVPLTVSSINGNVSAFVCSRCRILPFPNFDHSL